MNTDSIILGQQLHSIIKSTIDSIKGKVATQFIIENARHKILEAVYKQKLSRGQDLNRPLFDEYNNIGSYIGSEVIFDEDQLTGALTINYVECYGNAKEINAVFEDSSGNIKCVYFPRSEADGKDEDDIPYWFVWARSVENKKPVDYYRLWL